jgi:predicted phosphodiesterase
LNTAVISDLHLGTRTGSDLLGRPEIRRRLLAELESVDQLVLLGDSIELRDRPLERALETAAPFFEEIGEALAGRRVVLVAGNHDHALAGPWLERRRARGRRLSLEHLSTPAPGDPLARLVGRMGHTELLLAYPGLWLRPDVYATHGHYLDCHNQVATFECLARAVRERLVRAPHVYRSPEDYEAVLAPLYAAIHRVAQSRRGRTAVSAGRSLVRGWERAAGYRGPQGRVSRLLGRAAVPAALRVVEGAGLGAFRDDSSRPRPRRPGVDAMARVVESLRIEADYVLFGHLHRPGPMNGDAPEWTSRAGTRLVNTGSWVDEVRYLGSAPLERPHRPGAIALVGADGPPQLKLVAVLRGVDSDGFPFYVHPSDVEYPTKG